MLAVGRLFSFILLLINATILGQQLCTDPTLNFDPRITCPSDITIAADSLTCEGTTTWQFDYYPSPFYSTGIEDDHQTVVPVNGLDSHYFFPNYPDVGVEIFTLGSDKNPVQTCSEVQFEDQALLEGK